MLQTNKKSNKDNGMDFNWRTFIYLLCAFLIGAALTFYITVTFITSTSADQFVEACDRINGAGEWKVVNKTCVPINMLVLPEINNTMPMDHP